MPTINRAKALNIPEPASPDIAYARVDIHGFLPLPDRFMKRLGWGEGDVLQIEIIDNTLLITRKEPDAETTP